MAVTECNYFDNSGGVKTGEEIAITGGSPVSASWDFDAKCFIMFAKINGTLSINLFDLVTGTKLYSANASNLVWTKVAMSAGNYVYTEKTSRSFTFTTTLTLTDVVVVPLAEYPTNYDFS